MSAQHILKCHRCGSYALTAACACGDARVEAKPPKYSPDDRWAELKRQAKLQEGIY